MDPCRPTSAGSTIARTVMLGVAALTLTACSSSGPITGTVVDKAHHPGCTIPRIMGTASGALPYEETVDEAWVLTVRAEDPDRPGKRGEFSFHVNTSTWKDTQIGDKHTEEDPYWFHDLCDDPAAEPTEPTTEPSAEPAG